MERCRFFDSNPAKFIETVAVADGTKTEFSHRWSGDNQVFANYVVLEVIDPSTGHAILTAHDDGRGGWYGAAVAEGSVYYGSHHALGGFTITFERPPPDGHELRVTTARSDQRQPIAILGCEEVWVTGNHLSEGGRIKVGRPGVRCIIEGNIFENVNDNGISVADRYTTAGRTSELKILDNIVYFPSSSGIHVGADGEEPVRRGEMRLVNITIRGNTVVGNTMDGISVTLPGAESRRIHIHDNQIEALGTEMKNKAGIQITHTKDFVPGTASDINIHDNIVSGHFDAGLIHVKEGHHFAIHHNQLSGNNSTYGIRLGSLHESIIDHNNIRYVRFGVAQPKVKRTGEPDRAGSLRGVTITDNSMTCREEPPARADADERRGIVFFEQALELTRVRVLHNSLVGGRANTHAVAASVADAAAGRRVADVDVEGNDWSGAQCDGPRAYKQTVWSPAARHGNNKESA